MTDDRDILLEKIRSNRSYRKELEEQEAKLRAEFLDRPEEVEKRRIKEEEKRVIAQQEKRDCRRHGVIYMGIHLGVAIFTGLLYLGMENGLAIPVPFFRCMLLLCLWPITVIWIMILCASVGAGSPEMAVTGIMISWQWLSNSPPSVPMPTPTPTVHQTPPGSFRPLA